MSNSSVDAATVNRRIAEFCGWVQIKESLGHPWGRPRDGARLQTIPNYMHDANAAIAAAEKFCREKGLALGIALGELTPPTDGDGFVASICEHGAGGRCWAHHDKSLPTAISLALYAALGANETKH